MKLEYFIAKRLIVAKEYKSSISAPIIKIAITAIALGVIMMIVSIATGTGLQQKIQEKIFRIFQSLENSEKSNGLGLSIVKKIVDSYNGKIWIESEIGQGTTFFVQLSKKNLL